VTAATNKRTNTFTFSGAGIGVGCQRGTSIYQPIIVINGNFTNPALTLAAGDKVAMTVKMTKAKTSVSFIDLTSGGKASQAGKGKTGVLASIGDRSLSIDKKSVPLDSFTKTTITGAEVNGKPLASEKPLRYTWVRHKQVLVTASAITKGKDFTVSFKHS
jgi:Peptidase A4 family